MLKIYFRFILKGFLHIKLMANFTIFISLCLCICLGISIIELKLISFFGENAGKSFCQIESSLLNCGVFIMWRSFLKGVLFYNKVDKCCPSTYSLPSESRANPTTRAPAQVPRGNSEAVQMESIWQSFHVDVIVIPKLGFQKDEVAPLFWISQTLIFRRSSI